MLLLGVNIGARVSELTALTVCDVWQHSKVVLVLTLRKETIKGKRELYSIPPNLTAKAVISELIAWVQVHRILKKASQKASLTGKVTAHSMRKTDANKVYSATNDLLVVKEVLGHKNVTTTQQYLG